MAALILWIVLAALAMIGAGLAAASVMPVRRTIGVLAATTAVAALLLCLGLDLPAVVWLGLGGTAAVLAVASGGAPAPPERRHGTLVAGAVVVGLLLAILYRAALQVDWRPLAPEPVAGQTSLVGGALLTGDVALLGAVTLLLAATLAVTTVWRAGSRGRPS